MKNVYFLIIGLILFQNVRGQAVTAQSWFSYGNTNMGGYSWTNAALTTNSIEILNNVGTVSNSSPTLAFHRYGTGGPQFRLAADGSNVLFLESSGQNSARSPNAYGGGPNNYFSRFHVDGALTTTGNVGIGTSTPSATLEVNGNLKVALNGNQFLYNGAADLNLTYSPRGSGGRAVVHDAGNILTLNYAGDFTGGTKIGIQTYFSESASGTSYINGGNVGIGTATPDAKLSVNGTIHSKEVKVNLIGWPDYVFKSLYHLPALSKVKRYIDQNKHLPEVPSEKEILENGLNLGEMNKVLIKKVEELTLYLIEKDKKDQQQQDQINLLNHKLKTLSLKVQRKL